MVQNSADFVLSILTRSREAKLALTDLNRFVSCSLAGPELIPHLDSAITWLTDCSRLLAFRDGENGIRATSLGTAAARSSLPLPMAAAIAQLIRDLLSLGAEENVLRVWGEIDHLLIVELLADRSWPLRPFSAELAAKVDDAMERSSSKSILYSQWIRGTQGHSKAVELLGSLGQSPETTHDNPEEWCRRRSYSALFRATILNLRAHGESADNLSRNWGIEGISGFEEGWRDNRLWLLGAMAQIFDIKCFYYHLRADCAADDERIKRVKRHLQRLRVLALQTAAHVKHCSPLGPLLVQMRHGAAAGVGQKTVEKLEDLGIQSLAEIARLDTTDFQKAGIATHIANRLLSYARRRHA